MAGVDPILRPAALVLLLSLVVLAASCGAGESRSTAIEITEARLRGEAVLVTGSWAKGLSTPPTCKLLEGRDGETIGLFRLEDAAFDANEFSHELSVEDTTAVKNSNYHVRCSVTLDSAKVASDTVKVTG